MKKVTKTKMGKMDVTIIEHFPDDPKDMNKIRDTLAGFYVNQFRKMYPEEVLDVAIPVYQRILDLQQLGNSYEDSEQQAIKEFYQNKNPYITQSS